MKILFIAELYDYARSMQRLLALKDLGHEVQALSSIPDSETSSYRPSFWEKISWKLGYPIDTVSLNQRLPQIVQEFQPHLIWIEKVLTIHSSTYQTLKKLFPQTKIVFYSEDDIFLRHNRLVYLTNSLSLFDLVFTTKPRNLNELPKLGVKRVFCIYQAYDRHIHRPIELSESEKLDWGADVGFVGTFERDRAEQMLYLAQQGTSVRIWGNDWHKWKSNHPHMLVQYRPVLGEDFIRVICSTKINLNFLRKANRDRHTNRSLEIPACGAFMLAERSDEHQELFTEGQEAEFFDTPTELLTKVRYYLKNEELRSQIAKAGKIKCLHSGYSHHDRLEVMLKETFKK